MHEISALLIDSGDGWLNTGNPAYMLFPAPDFSISSAGDTITLNTQGSSQYIKTGDPVEELQNNLEKGYIAVGYIGFDYSDQHSAHKKPGLPKRDLCPTPDTYFHYFKPGSLKKGPVSELKEIIKGNDRPAMGRMNAELSSNISREIYIKTVNKARDYIAAGDIYQVNISQRYVCPHLTNTLSYGFELFHNQPVPYFAFMDFDTFQLVSGSMELFLSRESSEITTKPIKGTIKRSSDPEHDKKLARLLLSSDKERAENLMIVDLMRNDLSRICKYGTVKVKKLFNVKPYKTLYQMESEITGDLVNNTTIKEIIDSTFPPGSVTGAPKSRCLEIIDELEPHQRGPYCGAIGVFYPDGNFKLSVAIRIIVNTPQHSFFWVGGGIVWDSDPEKEYEETLLKAMATKGTMGSYSI